MESGLASKMPAVSAGTFIDHPESDIVTSLHIPVPWISQPHQQLDRRLRHEWLPSWAGWGPDSVWLLILILIFDTGFSLDVAFFILRGCGTQNIDRQHRLVVLLRIPAMHKRREFDAFR